MILTPEQMTSSEFVAGPKVTFNNQVVNQSAVLTRDNLRQIQERVLRVYVMGRIEYRDIFERARWITFCYTDSGAPSLLLTACTHHNKGN